MPDVNGFVHAGQIAVVSGATGGIGSAVVEALASRGATVVMLGRHSGRLRTARERIEAGLERPCTLRELVLDINDGASVEEGVATMVNELGRIDVLVNAAGDGPVAPLLDTDDEMWSRTVNGKLLGTIRLSRAVARDMVRRGAGRIVIVNGSFRKEPDPMFPINGTVNAGLAAFAKAISRDLGQHGIRVNIVDPGATDTPLWAHTLDELAARFGTTAESVNRDVLRQCPMGVLPAPIDIAEVVSFLSSDACRYVNGAAITVDGGASTAV